MVKLMDPRNPAIFLTCIRSCTLYLKKMDRNVCVLIFVCSMVLLEALPGPYRICRTFCITCVVILIYAVLDLSSGYWQMPVARESRKYTTFISERGTYRFTRVPFGLKNAPSLFQKALATEVLLRY